MTYLLFPDVQNQPSKQVPNKPVSIHAFIEEILAKETSITVPNIYETYFNNVAPGEKVVPLNVAEKSFALQSIMLSIDNKEGIEGIIDPGLQIIAMSKGMCHDIGLH
jgi:hypothetical protein